MISHSRHLLWSTGTLRETIRSIDGGSAEWRDRYGGVTNDTHWLYFSKNETSLAPQLDVNRARDRRFRLSQLPNSDLIP
jgi:hypothetical protein